MLEKVVSPQSFSEYEYCVSEAIVLGFGILLEHHPLPSPKATARHMNNDYKSNSAYWVRPYVEVKLAFPSILA
jgi:hypothetical protein